MAGGSQDGDGFQRWDALAPVLDDIQPRTMPFYAEAYAALARGAKLIPPDRDGLRLLDLGCGTGTSARTVLDVLGARVAAIDLVDGSRAMLDFAANRLGPFTGKMAHRPMARLQLSDLGAVSGVHVGYDMILSSFALHHLRAEEKRSLFKMLPDLARPGAIILLLDVHEVGPLARQTADLSEAALAGPAWDASVTIGDAALKGLPDSDANQDRPTSVAFVLESLADLGLEPEVIWSSGAYALIAAHS